MQADTLIINLTRFGDLLQTQAIIDDLHHAGYKPGLICLPNFSSALTLLRNVTSFWPLPGAEFLSALDRSWPAACQKLLNFQENIKNNSRIKNIINLTPTLPARLLTRLLNPEGKAKVLGFGIDELGFGVNSGSWASYLTVAAGSRGSAAFNLSDMFRMIADPLTRNQKGSSALALPQPEHEHWAKNFLAVPDGIRTPAGFIAFQLGASEKRRRWPVENFAALGTKLWHELGLCPVLTGSAAETDLAETYRAIASAPFIDAIGKTTIPELAALLSQCRLLVTNDTGTLHLAAGSGVPSLSFFMATAQPWDTGPALTGCCCLEPALACHPCSFGASCTNEEACRSCIKPAAAAALISGFIKHGTWRAGVTPEMNSQCRIWETKKFSDGLQLIEPLNEAAERGPGLWLAWQRRFWSAMLSQTDPDKSPCQRESNYEGLPKPQDAAHAAGKLADTAAMLAAIAETSMNAAKMPAVGKIFLKHCERLQHYLDNWQTLPALGMFWAALTQSHGDDLAELGKQAKIMAHHVRKLEQALVNQGIL